MHPFFILLGVSVVLFSCLYLIFLFIKSKCYTAYKYDAKGYFEGILRSCETLPYHCTRTAPPLTVGFIPKWNGASWELIENHKGEKGYINGHLYIIRDYGPYPDGWSTDKQTNPKEEKRKQEVEEVKNRLVEIDWESIRPLRALLEGTAVKEDREKLKLLNEEASSLRDKLILLV